MVRNFLRLVWALALAGFTLFCILAAIWGLELGLSASASVGVGQVAMALGVVAAFVGFCAPATAFMSALVGWAGFVNRYPGSSFSAAGLFGLHAGVIVLGLFVFGMPDLG
jgi:hypothetical protein